MTRTRRCLAIAVPPLLLLYLAGCGSGVPPRSPALDPSNADGPESPPFSGSPAVMEPPTAANVESAHPEQRNTGGAEQHVGHDHGAANVVGTPSSIAKQGGSSEQSTTFTCPMHPEVNSSQPGKCPKCGMTLIPKKDDP
jgi:hypothetical protein